MLASYFRPLNLVLICGCLVCGEARSATGQGVTPWAPECEFPFESLIDADIVSLIKDRLAMDDGQGQAIDELLTNHQAGFSDFATLHRPLLAQLDKECIEARMNAPEHWLELQLKREKELGQVADEQAALDQHFLDVVVKKLNQEQAKRWPGVVREIRRKLYLSRVSEYLEETVDLVDIVDRVAAEAELKLECAELDELLSTYAEQVDVQLVDLKNIFVKASRTAFDRQKEVWQHDEAHVWMDPSSAQDWERKFWQEKGQLRQRHRHVRDLNRATMYALLELLPVALQQPLRTAYTQTALQRVIRLDRAPTAEFLDRILKLDDLADQQRSDIDELIVAHTERVAGMHDTIIRHHNSFVDAKFQKTAVDELASRQDKLLDSLVARQSAEHEFIESVWRVLDEGQQGLIERPTIDNLVVFRK